MDNFAALLDEEIRNKYREKQPNAKFCHSLLNKMKTTTKKTTFKTVFSVKFHNKICILKRICLQVNVQLIDNINAQFYSSS